MCFFAFSRSSLIAELFFPGFQFSRFVLLLMPIHATRPLPRYVYRAPKRDFFCFIKLSPEKDTEETCPSDSASVE